jgi:hypothetical protein
MKIFEQVNNTTGSQRDSSNGFIKFARADFQPRRANDLIEPGGKVHYGFGRKLFCRKD